MGQPLVDAAGNVYVTGGTMNETNLNQDISTVKYDSAGNQQWVSHWDNAGNNEYGTAIAVDSNGDVYVAGTTSSNGTDMVLLKLDGSTGATVGGNWPLIYNSGATQIDTAIDVGVSGTEVVICGNSNGAIHVRRFDTSGTLISGWPVTYSTDSPVVNDMDIDSAGNIVIAGSQVVSSSNALLLLRYSAAGTLITTETNDYSASDDMCTAVTTDSSGNVFATGYIDNGTDRDVVVWSLSAAGSVQWSGPVVLSPSSTGNDEGNAITTDGTFVYVAGIDENAAANDDFVTYKLNAATGADVWGGGRIQDHNSGADDKAYDIAVDGAGYVLVVGYTVGSTPNYLTYIYDSTGAVYAALEDDGGYTDFGYAVELAPSGKFVIAGTGAGQISRTSGYWTRQYTLSNTAPPAGGDNGDDDDSGCITNSSNNWALLALLGCGLVGIIRRRRKLMLRALSVSSRDLTGRQKPCSVPL